MSKQREALQMALDTLRGWIGIDEWIWPVTAKETCKKNSLEAITAIREALAQPEQEPVAWTNKNAIDRLTGKMGAVGSPLTWGVEAPLYKTKTPDGVPLYTAPLINPLPIGFWNGKETAYFEHELVDGLLPTGDCTIPLYIDPPASKPLTDEEIMKTAKETQSAEPGRDGYILPFAFARAIERAHGIGD